MRLDSDGEWTQDRHEHGPDRAGKGAAQTAVERAGRFIGRILGIQDGIVTQRVSRQGETVLHSVANLSADVAVGDMADIHYRDGRGHVQSTAREVAR